MRRLATITVLLITLYWCGAALAQNEYDRLGALSVWQSSRQTYMQMQFDYIERLKRELAANPDNLVLETNLGRAYYNLALERDTLALFEAEKIFQKMLARDPSNAYALAYHGGCIGLKAGFELVPEDEIRSLGKQSWDELDRAVELAPDAIGIRYIRGYNGLYTPSFLGRDAKAVEDFTKIISILERLPERREDLAEAHLLLGSIYSKMGDREGARASWRRVVEILPDSRLAMDAEVRLKNDEMRSSAGSINAKEVVAFFGFLTGVIIFAMLTALILRDLVQARRSRTGMTASLAVSFVALLWNGLNLAFVIAISVGAAGLLRDMAVWSGKDLYLILSLAPIPIGLAFAYRFYKATFIDIALKRGAALLVMLGFALIYARLIEGLLQPVLYQMNNAMMRSILYTGLWLCVFALYLPLHGRIYRLVDRYFFKRRDYSRLLDWFNDRMRAVTDESSLRQTVEETLKEAFAADSAEFTAFEEELGAKLSKVMLEQKSDALLSRRIEDDELYGELERRRFELALAIRSGDEMLGVMLAGKRARGQGYLSEDISVLKAMAAQAGRTLENLRLHEARRRQAIAEQELRKLAAQAELKALRAQIDPHFFFNALNSVASLVADDPRAAEELIEDIAELFRHAFKPSREFISLAEEIELVETYLKVEKVRLGTKLQCRIAVARELLQLRIPALTIQPLVENAVKHGIGGTMAGGTVTLSAAVRNGCLSVCVADSGKGIAHSELEGIFSRGVGLSNVNDRLTNLYGTESELQIDSKPGQGTTVSFSIPVVEQGQDAVVA